MNTPFSSAFLPGTDIMDERANEIAAEIRSIYSVMKRQLRTHSNLDDLSLGQVDVLLQVEAGKHRTTADLARVAGVRAQSMAATVNELEAKGLLSRAPDPEDGRRMIISMAEGGRDWLARGRAARNDWLSRRIRDRLDPDEQRQLRQALRLLRRVAEG